MAQPFYPRKHELKMGPRKGETVYSAQPYYYGVIDTKQIASQISEESAQTRADTIAVIDRLAQFCRSHLNYGYKIKIDGLGTFFNEFVTTGTVNTAEEVTAKLVKSIRPAFKPEYTRVNGTYRYSLLPEKNELVKINFNGVASVPSEDEEEEDNTTGGGSGEDDEATDDPLA